MSCSMLLFLSFESCLTSGDRSSSPDGPVVLPAAPRGPQEEEEATGPLPDLSRPDTGTWLTTSPLPILLIDVGESIGLDERVGATLEVVTDHAGTLSDLAEAPRVLVTRSMVEVRGSTSATFPKQSFNLELQDDLGADQDMSLLGMPAEADWILYGPYADKTYIRDALAYTLARRFGGYAPRVRFVELILDGEYQGVYQVTEKIELDGQRLDFPEPVPADQTGTYIFKVEGAALGAPGWTSDRGIPYEFHDPSGSEITRSQAEWIEDWMDEFEEAMAAGQDPVGWIDLTSFADHVIVNELARNVDAYRRSAFLFKAPNSLGGRLHAGPVWDFNIAFGNADFCDGWNTEGFVWDSVAVCDHWPEIPFWWHELLTDARFTDPLRCRWEELRTTVLADEALREAVASLSASLGEAEPRDHLRWGTLGVAVWPNWYVGATWEDELTYLLDWTLARASWIDLHLPGTCLRAARTTERTAPARDRRSGRGRYRPR